MKVYCFQSVEEGNIYCFEDSKDVLATLESWSTEELKEVSPVDILDINQELIECKKVLQNDKGCFTGEFYSLWIDIRSRKWFESLPKDEPRNDTPF